MSKREVEQAWEKLIEGAAERLRLYLNTSPNTTARQSAWADYTVFTRGWSAKRRRQVMELVYEQLEMVFAQDAEDEIIFGGADDYGSLGAVCWVCDHLLIDERDVARGMHFGCRYLGG